VAFGFDRERGSARGYVNVSNPAFAPGQRLSRRQYDAFVGALGARQTLPPATAAQDIERRLEGLRQRQAAAEGRSRRTQQRVAAEIRAAEAQAEVAREAQFRRERQGAGQRRYNLMLDLYVRRQREAGRVLTKNQARSEAAFKDAVRLAKGTPNPTHNPNIVARNMRDRRRGFAAVGGADRFREEYEAQYGRPARSARRRNPRGRRGE
jgi:hypothetical protein